VKTATAKFNVATAVAEAVATIAAANSKGTGTPSAQFAGEWGIYFRVSTEEQNIETQFKTAVEFFIRHRLAPPPVDRWYVDIDWSRDETDRRPEWLRMLREVDEGKLRNLLVTAKDRFGTASGPNKVVYYQRLRVAGCKLVLATTDAVLNGPDLVSNINALVDGDQEERELRIKSDRAIDKLRHHAAAGRWLGGVIPAGLDVVCMEAGREVWRVELIGRDDRVKISPDGSRQTYEGENNFPARDKDQTLTLRPSLDAGRLAAIRDLFRWADEEAISVYQLAARLNERGERHPLGGEWEAFHVKSVLTNPAYIGVPSWNRTSMGKWSMWKDGRKHEHAEKNTKHYHHAKSDWVIPDQQFKPIVDPDQFERVQAKIAATKLKAPRAPKTPDLWLAGLLYCRHCGGKMHGHRNYGTDKDRPRYICASHLRGRIKRNSPRCPFYSVSHEQAVEIVRQYLDEIGVSLPQAKDAAAASETMPTTWEATLARLAASHREMIGRTGAFVSAVTLAKGRRPDGEIYPLKAPADLLSDYRQLFAANVNSDRAKIDQLEAEERELSLALALNRLPTQSAREHVNRRLAELAGEVAELRRNTTNAADQYEQALKEFWQLVTDWEAARAALGRDMKARHAAEAVRKVIERIDLTWKPTGMTKPKNYLAEALIVPKGSEEAVAVHINQQRRFGPPLE
jgi:DNA invertase Pin-like site-specific DNA recombinase